MVSNIYIHVYIYTFVQSCDVFQRMKGLPHYHTRINLPITNLFEVFSIYFSGQIVGAKHGKKKYILIFVNHFMNCPIAIITDNATSMELIHYVEK